MIHHEAASLRRYVRLCAFASIAIGLAACEQRAQVAQPNDNAQMEWARAALERNPHVEVVAGDPEAKVFTLRDRRTGEMNVVKLSELAAAPVAQLQAATPAAGRESVAQSAPAEPEQQTTAPQPTVEQPESASEPSDTTMASREMSATGQPSTAPGYTIERSEGQIRVSGPGVSIVSAGPISDSATSTVRRNAVEPIICEGRRMVHFDNREIYVEGDAITVRAGCEMYITNSTIVASGTGIVVRGGTVHVSNSHVEGAEGSFDADSEAKMFVRSSTFRGVPRRSELALVQDQGGNRWR